MRPKLILTDLDGTLLREDKTLSPINRAALERAAAQGAEVVVATGPLLRRDPLRSCGTCPFCAISSLMNGAKVYDRRTDKTLGRAEIPWETVEAVIDFLEPLHCSVDCFPERPGPDGPEIL